MGEPIFSPDDKYFLLVTRRGQLSTNTLEGTIWLFDLQAVHEYTSGKSFIQPSPRKLVVMRCTSNTPVIYDVRWIDGSKKIAFLGKNYSPYQRLFVAEVASGTVTAVTSENRYVTSYDIRNDTIAYAVLEESQKQFSVQPKNALTNVADRSIFDLLYPLPHRVEDIQEGFILRHANSLHVVKNGRESHTVFMMQGRILHLFIPILSISPDEKTLITVAPVNDIPDGWEQYQPRDEEYRLKSGAVQTTGVFARAPEEYVTVNLETGLATPLVAAPVGRDLGHYLPTEIFWTGNNQGVILTNTYLPLSPSLDAPTRELRKQHPAVALVDMAKAKTKASLFIPDPWRERSHHHIKDIEWDPDASELAILYANEGKIDIPIPGPERYSLRSGEWIRIQDGAGHLDSKAGKGRELLVLQDLNHPPMLWATIATKQAPLVVWDPNPQLREIRLGSASVYRWQDTAGAPWAGILALPPDYDARRRYALVIQTHGYDTSSFFTDGYATTANGGRALLAKNVIVLQMDIHGLHSDTPEEGRESSAGFESAIDQLAADGLVDRRRVGVIGFSRTCFHVLYALTHRPDMFAAASITDGVNFGFVEYSFAPVGSEYKKEAEAVQRGAPFGKNLLNWTDTAPTFNLDRVRTPLLMSALEQGELLTQWEVYSSLRALAKPVELLWWTKQNTPHILVQPVQRAASQQSAVDWFDFWLNDHEDPGSSKAMQYVRWRQLRLLREKNARSGGLTAP